MSLSSIKIGYKDYTEFMANGTFTNGVSLTGLDYKLFYVSIPNANPQPLMITNRFYGVDFLGGGGGVLLKGVYRYGGKVTVGANTRYYFAYYGGVYISTTAVAADIYNGVNTVVPTEGVYANGDIVTSTEEIDYYIGTITYFEGEIVLKGDSYTNLIDAMCSYPYFYIWLDS